MVTIYGTEICSFCLRAKRLAESYNIKYEWINANENKEALSAMVPGYETVPQIFWDGRHIGGYEEFATEVENTRGGYGDGEL